VPQKPGSLVVLLANDEEASPFNCNFSVPTFLHLVSCGSESGLSSRHASMVKIGNVIRIIQKTPIPSPTLVLSLYMSRNDS
jgi:hypothetical protein